MGSNPAERAKIQSIRRNDVRPYGKTVNARSPFPDEERESERNAANRTKYVCAMIVSKIENTEHGYGGENPRVGFA